MLSALTDRRRQEREPLAANVPTLGLILAVAVLVLNDHLLKWVWPGTISGKLSDLAGLFAFPLFFSALLPRYRAVVYWTTGTTFVLWKSPVFSPLIDAWNSFGLFALGRTVDVSDLLALLILPLSYRYALHARAFSRRTFARTFVCIVAIVAFAATSYRTTFDYHSLYFTPVSRKVLLDTLLELQDDGYNLLSVVRTREELDSMLTEAPRYFTFVDSGHWVAEVWIPDQFCSNNVDALISLAEDPDGTRIYLLRMEHHCPEGDDDRQKLFRIFDEKLAKRLGWEIMN